MYLIYETEIESIARADEEGKRLNYSYWTEGKGTRWLTAPVPTANGKWALDVSSYNLSELEFFSTEDAFTPLEESEGD
jgi:hypothetical protein